MNNMDLEITETNQFDDDNTKNKRGPKKDRSEGKYSQEDFQAMSREEQFEIASDYYMRSVEEFDDGTFNFSQSTFKRLCDDLGFVKGLVDTKADEMKNNASVEKQTIWLDDIERENVSSKKFTISEKTKELCDEIFSSSPNLSNKEKSIIMDLAFQKGLKLLLDELNNDEIRFCYRPISEKTVLGKP